MGSKYAGLSDTELAKALGMTGYLERKGQTQTAPQVPTKHGYWSMLLVNEDMVYTVNFDGSPYKRLCKAKSPPDIPYWYCPPCGLQFFDWPSANAHRNSITK